jgi:hypothetical protein
MALSAVLTERSYQSETGGEIYYFTIALDQAGNCTVRQIRTPTGLLRDSFTGVPGPVLDDINTGKAQLEDLVAQTSAVNGILTFADEVSQAVVFVTPFSNDEYGVFPTLPDFLTWKITSKTTTGFTIELGSKYTGDVRYDVFV